MPAYADSPQPTPIVMAEEKSAVAQAATLPQPATTAVTSSGSVEDQVRVAFVAAFGVNQWGAAQTIISRESGFNPYAVNASSGACGLFQNINCTYALGDVGGQITWGINYIKARYGSPSLALAFWNGHGWY